jgi:hypothetical protein
MQLLLYAGIPKRFSSMNLQQGRVTLYLKIKNDVPFLGANGFPVNLGVANSITLSRSSYSKMISPYSSCTVLHDNTLTVPLADRSMFDFTVQTNYTYSQQLCIYVCRQKWTVQECGYNNRNFPFTISNVPLSELGSFATPADTCSDSINTNRTIGEYCTLRCPLECAKSLIEIDSTETNLNKKFFLSSKNVMSFDFASDLPNGTSLNEFIISKLAVVEIKYGSLSYMKISEEPKMEWEELLGELSGHLHLFLGLSILSFVEILELFAFMLFGRRKSMSTYVI